MADSWAVENRPPPAPEGEYRLSRDTRSYIRDRSTRLKYPLIDTEQSFAKIRFAVHEAEPLSLDIERAIKAPIFDNVTSWFDGKKAKTDDNLEDLRIQAQDPRSEGDAARARLKSAEEAKEIKDTESSLVEETAKIAKGVSYKLHRWAPIVDMYLPISMVYNDMQQYDTPNLGVVGGATLTGMSAGQGAFASAYEGLMGGIESVFGYMSGSVRSEDLMALGALRTSKLVPSTGFQAAVSLGVQTSLNPNTRALFRGVNLREFTFQFKMVPKSEVESIICKKIVRHFRAESYPELIDVKGVPVAYKFPNAFSIQFTHRGIEADIPKLNYCFLRSVQTTYNASGGAVHPDGRPTEIDITLNFVEMRTVDRNEVYRGK